MNHIMQIKALQKNNTSASSHTILILYQQKTIAKQIQFNEKGF